MLEKLRNKFRAAPSGPMAKGTNFVDIDSGQVFKWNGKRWIKACAVKGQIDIMEVDQIYHAICLSIEATKNPILNIWVKIPAGTRKERICPICNEKLFWEHAVIIEKIEYDFTKLGDDFDTGG